MLHVFAQTPTVIATPSPVADVGVFVQDTFQKVIGIDIALAFRLLGMWLFIIWIVFALWVAIDAASRYKQWQIAMLWFLFVLPFNVLGFVGYLFMRPSVTLDENQWTKLESKYLMHELSSVNDCPSCGTLVPTTQNYCSVCGTQMNVNCSKCDALQSIYNVHCSNCGTKMNVEESVSEKPVHNRESILHRIQRIFGNAKEALAQRVQAAKAKSLQKKEEKNKQKDKKKKDSSDKKTK